MLPRSLRRFVALFLLAAFGGLFGHELAPDHAAKHADGQCQLCEHWGRQAVLEAVPAPMPLPVLGFVQASPRAQRPLCLLHFVRIATRGPPTV